MDARLIVSAPPHVRAREGTARIMWLVTASLLPATLSAVWFFRLAGLRVICFSVAGALAAEWAWQKVRRHPSTVADGSAFLTGLLLALTLPPQVPWWLAVTGGVVSILLGKMVFGGLGWNIFNPALVGRAFLTLSWVRHMTRDWYRPFQVVDAKTSATPLFAMKLKLSGELPAEAAFDQAAAVKAYLWGNLSGCVGETSALLLLAGGIFLLAVRIIDWRIPATYLGTVALLTFLLGRDPLFYLLGGGLLLGAFFMATDYVTSCVTPKGRLLFGTGCGVVTVVLRFYSGLPESVMFAILFLNMCAPLIERYTIPRKFGWVKAS